jgi:NTE family protein
LSRRFRILLTAAFVIAAVVVVFRLGRVSRPSNPPLAHYQKTGAVQFERLELKRGRQEDLVILAFSGGGTRAAAFAYGALETLRRVQMVQDGRTTRMLDEIDLITGVSGGSFTALAYGLYGEKLFDEYESRFLRKDVQGMLVHRLLNPRYWPALASSGWGRSEMAADLYDELLFQGKTFADMDALGGPAIAVGATDLSSGARVVFTPQNFDVMCADLGPIRLARAAAASSAVPVVLSPLTIDNYGGRCGYEEPSWLKQFTETNKPPRPAGRLLKRLQELRELDDANEDRYFHLVDGGVSDNLGLRSVLDYLETFEALRSSGQPTPLDHVKRIIIFVVNSVSSPSNVWNESENPPAALKILEKTAGVPIDRYATESVELLRDIDARWTAMREIRRVAKPGGVRTLPYIENAPDADIFAIDVSFGALQDEAQRRALNELPTTFHLPDDAIDRLRAAAATIILSSPDLKEVLREEAAVVLPASSVSEAERRRAP